MKIQLKLIILSYYNCILQKQRLELLQKVVNLSRERVIYQKTKYDIGVSSKMELLQFKNTLLTDSSNLLIQKQNLNNAIKNLNLVMGVDLNSEWVFTDKMNSEIQVFNLNNLKEKTLENNINILNQNINNEIIKQEITLQNLCIIHIYHLILEPLTTKVLMMWEILDLQEIIQEKL